MKKHLPYVLFFLLALSIMLPLYKPGFIFLLDMVWGPKIDLADFTNRGIPNTFPIILTMKSLSLLLPIDTVQKIVLTLTLILPAVTMFHLAKKNLSISWATLSSVFYMINPFVYERFLAGHWYILLGYGLSPLAVKFFSDFLENHHSQTLLKFVILDSLFPLINLHFFYITSLFLVVFFFISLILNKKLIRLISHIRLIIIPLLIFLLINSFWLLQIFQGTHQFNRITKDDLQVYRPLSDPKFGLFFNLASLYGFWQEYRLTPKTDFPLWWLAMVVIITVSFIGLIRLIRQKNPLAITLAIIFIPVVLIAAGNSNSYTKQLVSFLFDFFPGFKGLRETEKIVGILAFAYALLFPLGLPKLKYLIIPALFLPILLTNTFFWGLSGQVKSSRYPTSYNQVETLLNKEQGSVKVLVLPWHAYINFPYTQYRVISNPAKIFFSRPVVSATTIDNPEKTEVPSQIDQSVKFLAINPKAAGSEIPILVSQGITHIVLFKVDDFDKYVSLSAPNLRTLFDSPEIKLWKILTSR